MFCKNDVNEKDKDLLFHYCTAETFYKIVCGQKLRFSDISKSNDSREIKLLFDLYKKWAREKGKEISDFFIQNAFNLDQEHHRNYCFCLTENGNILSQWRGYAPSGGFSIGFSKEKLNQYLSTISTLDGKTPQIGAIEYVDEKDERLDNVFEEIGTNNAVEVFHRLRNTTVLFKSKMFKEEAEKRIWFDSFMSKPGENEPILRVDGIVIKMEYYFNRGNIISYYDLPFCLKMIDKIIIGPLMRCSVQEIEAFMQSQSCGCGWGGNVEKSGITLQ